MSTFEQELASLEDILKREILVGIEPPYEDQAKLSQVALRIKKSQRLSRLTLSGSLLNKHNLLLSLIYLKNYRSLGISPFKTIDLFKSVTRFLQLNNDLSYSSAFDSLRLVQNSESEGERLRRFAATLHQPVIGVVPAPRALNYISLVEKIYMLPERKKELFSGRNKNEKGVILRFFENFFKQIIPPTIIDFPHYTFSERINFDNYLHCFFKWVDPVRVPTLDHEINMANQLQQKGINVPTFYGYGLAGDNAYLIAKAVEGVDFLRVHCVDDLFSIVSDGNVFNTQRYIGPFIHLLRSSFHQKITFPFLKEKVTEAYFELGQEVRKVVEAGLVYPDVALRNSMLTYDQGKPKVTSIDFEQATRVDTVTDGMRGATIGTIGTQLASASLESKQLYKGFWK